MPKHTPTEPINPTGLCMCGCGQPAPIAPRTYSGIGWVKGQPIRYIRNHHGRFVGGFVARFWRWTDKRGPDDCWIWSGQKSSRGYGVINVGGKNTYAHRIAYELSHGVIPDGMYVCHACDRKLCVNPAHLWIGTTDDNMADMVAKGRSAHGERNGRAKLAKDDVWAIRTRYAAGETQAALAREWGLGRSTVSGIVRHQTWKHV